MSSSPEQAPAIREVRDYLSAELKRARSQLSSDQWQALLVGVSDQGVLTTSPCRLVLPFHYPHSVVTLDERQTRHFDLIKKPLWSLHRWVIPEFESQYKIFAAVKDRAESLRVSSLHRQQRMQVLREASALLDQSLTVFGIASDNETWWEINTFHISGPPIPAPPHPISDIQILSRLCRHTHTHIARNRFQFEDDAISEVSFDGPDTTDTTIDLLRDVPRLRELLGKLNKMSLQSTLVTDRSLRFLETELPHVHVSYSHVLG